MLDECLHQNTQTNNVLLLKVGRSNYLHGVMAPPGVDRLFVLDGCFHTV